MVHSFDCMCCNTFFITYIKALRKGIASPIDSLLEIAYKVAQTCVFVFAFKVLKLSVNVHSISKLFVGKKALTLPPSNFRMYELIKLILLNMELLNLVVKT